MLAQFLEDIKHHFDTFKNNFSKDSKTSPTNVLVRQDIDDNIKLNPQEKFKDGSQASTKTTKKEILQELKPLSQEPASTEDVHYNWKGFKDFVTHKPIHKEPLQELKSSVQEPEYTHNLTERVEQDWKEFKDHTAQVLKDDWEEVKNATAHSREDHKNDWQKFKDHAAESLHLQHHVQDPNSAIPEEVHYDWKGFKDFVTHKPIYQESLPGSSPQTQEPVFTHSLTERVEQDWKEFKDHTAQSMKEQYENLKVSDSTVEHCFEMDD